MGRVYLFPYGSVFSVFLGTPILVEVLISLAYVWWRVSEQLQHLMTPMVEEAWQAVGGEATHTALDMNIKQNREHERD